MKNPYTSSYNDFVSGIYRHHTRGWPGDWEKMRSNYGVGCYKETIPKWKMNMFLNGHQEVFTIALNKVNKGNTRISYSERHVAGEHMSQIWYAYCELLERLERIDANKLR